jgi:predicted TIM-barrel fold metal-dependent hydrolase
MAVRGELAHTRAKNDELIALAKRYPQLTPIASVHPYDGEAALAELERLDGLGVKAIKLHPHTQKFDAADERVLAVCKRAGELGFVVLMDNANIVPGDNQKLFNLALQCPKAHFVFTHLGALEFRFWNILPLARTAKNLLADNFHFDISGTVILAADSPLEEEFVWTLRNVGIDNLLLGSDFPQMSLQRAVDALNRLGLTEEEKRKIRWENASRLLSLRRTDSVTK